MTTKIAQKLQRNQTDAEGCLWRHLRNRRLAGHTFRRQYPIAPYVVDFICLEKKRLIIELDGGQHVEQQAADAQRSAFLREGGFRMIRFWNDELLRDSEAVLEVISPPLPVRGEGNPISIPVSQGGEGDLLVSSLLNIA